MRWSEQMHESQTHAEIEVTISNPQGLHARPVMRFVDLASTFGSAIRVCKDALEVDGKSPMEMMLLEATLGTPLRLVADGDDALSALEALRGLIDGQFGES